MTIGVDEWSPKDPSEVMDYTINWTNLLVGAETISTSTWSVSPSGLTLGTESDATPNTSIWLSGGTAGTTYMVNCRITTSGGRTHERTILIEVENL